MSKAAPFSCGHDPRRGSVIGKHPKRSDICDRLISWETSRAGLVDEHCTDMSYRAMSGAAEWLVGEMARAGGVDTTPAECREIGYFYGTYRKFYLRFLRGNELHIARVRGFDRWANSRVYEGTMPVTMAALDVLLDRLKKDTGARQRLYDAMLERLAGDLRNAEQARQARCTK